MQGTDEVRYPWPMSWLRWLIGICIKIEVENGIKIKDGKGEKKMHKIGLGFELTEIFLKVSFVRQILFKFIGCY